MAANPSSQPHGGPIKRTSFSSFPGNNASIFLEKAKAGIRGSTPDSEALASSDDEQDHYHRLQSINQNLGPRPTRRPSWLTEIQHAPQRKGSLSGGGTFSPVHSHPPTPATDQSNWGTAVAAPAGSTGRGHAANVSFPWGNAIWNSESQRGPPDRLTEVLPSPTSMVPPGSAGFHNEEPMLSPPTGRENAAESAIPFAIPLQPTLKTYRSQSYSVGQLDPDSAQIQGGQLFNGRTRSGVPYGGLQHRPSRPSMLGDMSHDPTLLGQLREVEDDDESSTGSDAGVQLSTTQARTIEQLAMENALLRQAAAEQLESNRGRSRAVTSNPASQAMRSTTQGYNQRIQESVPEETESALYDLEDSEANQLYTYTDLNGRRASEYVAKGRQFSVAGIPENRTLESVKKGHWQSSLGFGGIGDQPQSRRHSFADVPTRQTSLSSASESQKSFVAAGSGQRTGGRIGSPSAYGEGLCRPSQGDSGEYEQFRIRQRLQEQALELEHLRNRNFAVSYFSGIDPSFRSGDGHGPTLSPTTLNPVYQTHTQYGRSQHPGHQPRLNQLLYIVTFKACRADVFYVQEGTGLQVKPGDLVIVEADRGTDLGTVAHDTIPWSKAKEMKEHYIEEHYRWLMIFSRHGQEGTPGANPNGQAVNPNGARNGTNGGAGGPMGTPDVVGSDLKPKMIKRLAQAHEIQTLRDKEGNEAKAKRVCQQKVAEHRLNMEILDAEFQMYVMDKAIDVILTHRQGLEEADVLLLCRLLYQLQSLGDGFVQNIQNTYLDVGHKSCVIRHPCCRLAVALGPGPWCLQYRARCILFASPAES